MRIIIIFSFVLIIITNIQAKIINVPADIDSIQGGIDLASPGDTVLVQPGTYVENINFNGKNIVVGSLTLTTGNASYISKTIIDGSKTIDDGDMLGNSAVTFINNVDSTAVLCGFTITNGIGGYVCGAGCLFWGGGISSYNSNPTLSNLLVTGNSGYGGGGMYLSNSNPKLINVTITKNSAYEGGGIHFGFDSRFNDAPVSKPKFDSINRCNIYSNYATRGSDLYLANDTLSIKVFVDTFTVMHPTNFHTYPEKKFSFDILTSKIEQSNSDLYVSPAGNNNNNGLTKDSPLKSISYSFMKISADSLNPHTIYLANGEYDDEIINNSPISLPDYISLIGESSAGVIFNEMFTFYSSKAVSIENLTIIGDEEITRITSDYSNLIIKNAILKGTTIRFWGSNAHIENVKITGNKGNISALGIVESNVILMNVEVSNNSFSSSAADGLRITDGSNVNLINSTISNNKSFYEDNGGIHIDNESSINIVNSIIWNNTPDNIYGGPNIYAFYSDIQDGWQGIGVINADPMFVETTNGDYRLQAGSPCIDAGIQDTMIIYNDGQDTLIIPPMAYLGSAPDIGVYEFDPSTYISTKSIMPYKFALEQNYPNPFNPQTTIEFTLPKSEFVTLKIYNLLGQEVKVLVSDKLVPGFYKYTWDASDFASGIYFYRLETENRFVQSRKLVLLK